MLTSSVQSILYIRHAGELTHMLTTLCLDIHTLKATKLTIKVGIK